MFRIYAIVYCNHFSKLESVGASSHLNTSFKVSSTKYSRIVIMLENHAISPNYR